MGNDLNRRDFLKLFGLSSMALGTTKFHRMANTVAPASTKPNIVVVVFDAWSAKNVSLYGYPRETTPNINRLANQAIVYHKHYASGRFTPPGTASMLTGTLPWTHGVTSLWGSVFEALKKNNIFEALPDYNRIAYTHNPFADALLKDFVAGINQYTPAESLYLNGGDFISRFFLNDADISSLAVERSFAVYEEDLGLTPYSLFSPQLYQKLQVLNYKKLIEAVGDQFPRGFPNARGNPLLLEDGIDWLLQQFSAPSPSFGYYHFYPPHAPYASRKDTIGLFDNDGYRPVEKPIHRFAWGLSAEKNDAHRLEYDEFIAYVDAEFGRLYRGMQENDLLDNTWIILTSDHGEIFERGSWRHKDSILYDPLIQVPLLIFPPGQTNRVDIYENTSAIDLLPTICNLTGNPEPTWAEGRILPGIGDVTKSESPDVFSIDYKIVADDGRPEKATIALVRGDYKLMYMLGYGEDAESDPIELYNLREDPEELDDLAKVEATRTAEMLATVKTKIDEAYQVYLELA